MQNRAKLFNPFDSLKGLQEALRKKEEEIETSVKKELSEEAIDEISKKLYMLRKGSIVTITYYCNKKYTDITGIIKDIRISKQKLVINEQLEIEFKDILKIIIHK